MEFSLAPMEGITGYVTRNAFHNNFNYIDKYYTPFIPAAKKMSKKIIRDIHPDNNVGMQLIPQIMTNRVDEALDLGEQLKAYGYDSMNINLGCPSGTVVGKKRGSGFLTIPDELDRFLYELYSKTDMTISIKTRIGFDSEDEWERLLNIYCKYPIPELIIHPRIQKDFYKNTPRLDAFRLAVNLVNTDTTNICYNGDITDTTFWNELREQFPSVERYMIGRGLYAFPALIPYLDSDTYKDTLEEFSSDSILRTKLRSFHDDIINGYLADFSGERDAMFHMKEIWSYLRHSFVDSEKGWKKIRKAQTLADYNIAVNSIFNNCPLSAPIKLQLHK